MPTAYENIREQAELRADKVALISEEDGTRTYAELARNACALAHAFVNELGLAPGDRAASWMWNRPEWAEFNLACSGSGVSHVPANPQWSDAELGFVLEHAGARLIACDAEGTSRAMGLKERVPTLEHVVVTSGPVPDGAIALESLLGAGPPDPGAKLPEIPSDIPGQLMYTSGTSTGRAKAVRFSRDLSTFIVDYKEMFDLNPDDRGIFVTPLFHGNGMGALSSALMYGASVVFQRRFSASRFWALVEKTQPTYFYTLGPIAQILMGLPSSPEERSHRLRVMIALGAGPSLPAMEERFRVPVIDWYGMTEAGSGTYTRLDEERRPGSAGRPFDPTQMKILREDGSVADPGEVGEVCFDETRIHFRGYVNDDEATAAVMRDGWFHTGDLGYFDDDGYFFFVDRLKDIVRRGGENVSGMEVESVLLQHPGVAEVAVLGRPDPILGERIVAFVVPAMGAKPPSLEDLRKFGETSLATFKLPEEVHTSEGLPRTATGKVQKFALRKLLPDASQPKV
jgi:acyl-CoA synthetase (AMP-forming)/AMP-acid ligase II